MTNLPAKKGTGLVLSENARLTPIGIPDIKSITDRDELEAIGEALGRVRNASRWGIADWAVRMLDLRYGEATKLAGMVDLDPHTLFNLARVARAFESSRRRELLSISHHIEVAGLSPADADRLLDKAEADDWPAIMLRQAVHELRNPPVLTSATITTAGGSGDPGTSEPDADAHGEKSAEHPAPASSPIGYPKDGMAKAVERQRSKPEKIDKLANQRELRERQHEERIRAAVSSPVPDPIQTIIEQAQTNLAEPAPAPESRAQAGSEEAAGSVGISADAVAAYLESLIAVQSLVDADEATFVRALSMCDSAVIRRVKAVHSFLGRVLAAKAQAA